MSDPVKDSLKRYWRANLRIMVVLLTIWAVVGLGCGVIWADWLNQYHIGGAPLGFWMAQQGSIVVFVVLILIYALMMNRLDRKHHEELQALRQAKLSTEPGDAGQADPVTPHTDSDRDRKEHP